MNNVHIIIRASSLVEVVAFGDWRNAQRLRRIISLGSREIRTGDELRYGVRLVDLDVNPLSEALLLRADVPGAIGVPKPR